MEENITIEIESTFDYLSERALGKFIHGRTEHGDDLRKLDCFSEFLDEIADLVNYVIIMRSQYEERLNAQSMDMCKMQEAARSKGNGVNGSKRAVLRQGRKASGSKSVHKVRKGNGKRKKQGGK